MKTREPLDDEGDPRRWLVLEIDPVGRALEMVVLEFDADPPLRFIGTDVELVDYCDYR